MKVMAGSVAAAIVACTPGPVFAQLPAPLVQLSFHEATGTMTTNSGTLGGAAPFAQTLGFPVFTTQAPAGTFAPAANGAAVDFGSIAAGQGGRAIDLSSGTLGALAAFTVCGWVNARDLTEGFGGNRIAFALASPNGPGFDLVQLANGALRLGINQWPDGSGGGGPSSSAGRITADVSTGNANWVFFAVTYDSSLASGHVKYYFGKPAQAAALDGQATYARGPITTSGNLTVGNFSSVVAARTELGPAGGSRVFRGLVDELRVFEQALSLAQIQSVQVAPEFQPADLPPVLVQVIPATNTIVRQIGQIEVLFNEPVQGVQAADLLINGSPATNLLAVAPDEYVFHFPAPATGVVNVAFAPTHGITDTGTLSNAFSGAAWTYTLDPNAPVVPPIITEFLADNDNTLDDEDGDGSDWIEVFNPGLDVANLEGWFLTDDAANLTKWRFPAYALAPGEFLVVFASQKNRTNSAAPLHTNFGLDRSGEYLALVDSRTNVVSQFAPAFPPQAEDISYGRDRVSPEFTGFFATPTPGAPNATRGAGISPAVTFSHPSGHFTNSFALTLSTPASNAVIRYILVNSAASAANTNVPGTNSPIYAGPLSVTNSVQVRARAFVPGFLPGEPASETYLALQAGLLSASSDLPVMVVHTLGGGDFNTTTFNPAHVSIYEPRHGRTTFTNQPTLNTRAALRVRGNTSANSAKKGWTLELRDEFNADKDVSLLGLPAQSDWVLYGPNAIEPVMIHNPFAFELARRMGQWAPRTRFVEVYLNTAGGMLAPANYHGLYVLTEKVKVADERIDESHLDAADTNATSITGTYLMQVDRRESGEAGILVPPVLPNTLSGGGNALVYTDPKESEIVSPQRRAQEFYIRNYLTNFVNTLNSPGYQDGVTGYVQYVNLAPSIDQHLLKTFTLTVDAFNFSSYFYKPRGGKLVFGPVWDFDRALESNNDSRDDNPRVWRPTTAEIFDFFNYSWWGRMFQDTNFWQLWVDRYQELRETELSQSRLFALVDDLVEEIRESQARDVARWPGVTTPRTGVYQWEVDHMKEWMTNRLHFMDTNFLRKPLLNTAGGHVTNGFVLSLTGPATPANSEVYFTLNGTDPRLPGGGISPSAQLYASPITISNNTHVVARSRNLNHRNLVGPANGNPPANTPWSGPVNAVLIVQDIPLVVTEIMYHPAPPPFGNTNDADNFEYIELRNVGTTALSLPGIRFTNGIDFTFTATSGVTQLPPGGRVLLVKHLAAFQSRYPGVLNVAGEYGGNLANDGERLTLVGALGEPILDFSYDDDWYPITDGPGFSLVILDDHAPLSTWNLKTSWRPSGEEHGSPGAEEPAAVATSPIFVNEALTHTDPTPGDAIELFNPGGAPVNIGDWYLTDDFGAPKKFRIPAGTLIPGGGHIVFQQSNSFGVGPLPFALSSLGDEVYLFSGNAAGELTGYFHGFDFGAQFNGVSFGRHVVSTGNDHFVAQIAPTFGGTNFGPRVGPIVISEIHYHPPDLLTPIGPEDNALEEFIELRNISASSVSLFDPARPTNTWRLRDAIAFSFPHGFVLPAGGMVLVVGFPPHDTALSNAFATRFAVPAGIPVLGPFAGQLDNSSDSVELVRPDAPVLPPAANAGFVPYVLADKVRYEDALPWNGAADGFGVTLQRLQSNGYGNDPANWIAALPGAGAATNPGGTPPTILSQPVDVTVVGGQATNLSVTASGAALRYQWRANGTNIPAATNAVLLLTNVQLAQAGDYSVAVFNAAGSVLSSNVTVTVLAPVVFTLQPVNQNVLPGTNVTLAAAALGNGTLRYQWFFEGSIIVGATNSTYSFTNASVPSHHGTFFVTVTDDISSATSTNARVFVLVRPVIVTGPAATTVLQGQTAVFKVTATGAPPLYFRWVRNGVLWASNLFPDLVITNAHPTNSGSFRVTVGNLAGSSNSLSVTLTVRADNDRDGMADDWERQFGFATNNANDAMLDLDGDLSINRDEFIAGTDPANHLSVLKILVSNTNATVLNFVAQSNVSYTLQFRTNLALELWQNLTNINAQPGVRTAEVQAISVSERAQFYRVVTPQQD